MFCNTQIVFGGVPIRHFEILNKKTIPPDNEVFYTLRITYTDGVLRIFNNIPKIIAEMYITTLQADGISLKSVQKPRISEPLRTMLNSDLYSARV